MSFIIAAAVLYLIFVHGPEGQEIDVNVHEISSIRRPQKGSEYHFAHGTNCLLVMSNGKFIATVETCKQITAKIADINAAHD